MYLDGQEGDSAEGSLHLYIGRTLSLFARLPPVNWICQVHSQQHLNQGTLEKLKHLSGDTIAASTCRRRDSLSTLNQQPMQINVAISSMPQITYFISPSWRMVEKLCRNISDNKAVALEIDLTFIHKAACDISVTFLPTSTLDALIYVTENFPTIRGQARNDLFSFTSQSSCRRRQYGLF